MYSTGEDYYKPKDRDLSAKIEYEKDVTANDIIREADQIFRKYRKMKIDIRDYDRVDKTYNDFRKEHKEFATTYPIVIRYMIQMGQYNKEAFKLYLFKLTEKMRQVQEAGKTWSEDDFLDSQADYVKILYMKTNRKWKRKPVDVWRETRSALESETKNYKEYLEKFQKEVEDEEKVIEQRKKQYIMNRIRYQKYLDDNKQNSDVLTYQQFIKENNLHTEMPRQKEFEFDEYVKELPSAADNRLPNILDDAPTPTNVSTANTSSEFRFPELE